MELSPVKVAHVIIKAREYDVKVAAWGDSADRGGSENESDAVLENHNNDSARGELAEFIAGLNVDEQVELVALFWVGRGTFSADEWDEAVDTARSERVNKTEDYLLGIPLMADFLEDGLEALGISVEDAENALL